MSSTGTPARSSWSGKWAFILAAAASAVGLGNMWRFPYLAYLINGPEALADGGNFFSGFITSNTESFLWMLLFMAIVFIVVSLGVKGGIEKANLIMMPALIVMAVAIAAYTLMQPGAAEGALYYLVPDFSKFSPELVIGALGQMFYSLSLAMGIMITRGCPPLRCWIRPPALHFKCVPSVPGMTTARGADGETTWFMLSGPLVKRWSIAATWGIF